PFSSKLARATVNQKVLSSITFGEPNSSDFELSGLLVNCGTAATCWKWPILWESCALKFAECIRLIARSHLVPGPVGLSACASQSLRRRMRVWLSGLCEEDQESVLCSLRMRPVNGFEIARRYACPTSRASTGM